jgi:predicted dehydrogenase
MIKVGIIGTGRLGIDWQLPDIREAGGEVMALADVVEGRAARFAAERNVPYAFDDYRELLALDDVEAVSICTPPFNHAEIAVASLRAGKHVYLEKPPTMNEAEMQFVSDVAWQTGQIMLVGSNGVYHNEIQLLKRAIDRGELGELYMIECIKTSRRRLPMGWLRVKELAGAGIGFDSSTHTLDHVLYLLGSPKPVSVTGRTYRHFADHPSRSAYTHMDVEEGRWEEVPVMETEDTLVAMVQFENGCSLLLKDCYAANMPDFRSFRMYGTEAGATLHPLRLYGETADGVVVDQTPHVPPDPEGRHVQAFEHFFACIRKGIQTESPPERSVITMRILDAIYASAEESGTQIRFD